MRKGPPTYIYQKTANLKGIKEVHANNKIRSPISFWNEVVHKPDTKLLQLLP